MATISFVIIAYNEEKNIANCVQSILDQENLEDFELIVVDDGSKDTTAEIVTRLQKESSRIKLNRLMPNQGRGAARAAGIQTVTGTYVALIDADIVLPPHWLKTCLEYMSEYDAVGGVALPDGDVNYIWGLFNLKPKKVHHSTVITGSNGLYKRQIFKKLSFNKNLRDGEDIAFNHFLTSSGFKARSIESLVVIHRESKSYRTALHWLYQSGLGASRQLKQFGKIRLPDLVFFTFLLVIVFSLCMAVLTGNYYLILLIPVYVLFASCAHVYTRFYFNFNTALNYISAIFFDSVFLASYFCGRTIGLVNNLAQEK